MATFYEQLAAALADGPVAVATIVRVKGSTPREVGTKMAVHPFGRHIGTVGGGCGEAEVIRTALDVLADGLPRLVEVDLTEPLRMESQGVCGGILDVYVERWTAADQGILPATLLRAQAERSAVALATVLHAESAAHLLFSEESAGVLATSGARLEAVALGALEAEARAALAEGEHRQVALPGSGARAFIEVQLPPMHLIICGAGHIAQPLARIASLCDYQVTVIDDRAAWAGPDRFPSAAVRAGDFRAELRALRGERAKLGPRTSLVLVTRGHQYDVDCLLEVIDDGVDYIGMIGSKRRIRAVFEMLQSEHGVARERFETVHAPVGLDIGSRTPGEIAVAIVAELINVARGGPGLSLSRRRAAAAVAPSPAG